MQQKNRMMINSIILFLHFFLFLSSFIFIIPIECAHHVHSLAQIINARAYNVNQQQQPLQNHCYTINTTLTTVIT